MFHKQYKNPSLTIFVNFYLGHTLCLVEFQIPLLMTFMKFNFEELKICPGMYVFMCRK